MNGLRKATIQQSENCKKSSANSTLREKNERLAEQALKGLETKTIEKEVVKEIEVAPADYDAVSFIRRWSISPELKDEIFNANQQVSLFN